MADKISVVVPCYNEEESLPLFYEEVSKVLTHMPITYELIFVNDGSSDQTLKLLQRLAQIDPCVTYYSFSRNFGKEAAMCAGMKEADGDFVVLMDADLQHPPFLLQTMYEMVKDGVYDCAGAKRMSRDKKGKLRNVCSHMFYKLIASLSHMEMDEGQGDYRMMNRMMVDSLLSMQEYNRYLKGMFSFIGFNTKWIPYDNVERCAGTSKWGMRKLFAYAMEGILSFSTAPLLMAAAAGTLCMLFGILFFIYIIVSGITSLKLIIAVLMLIGGMQLFFIGIVGEYLAKNYLESKHRPLYIIKESSKHLEQ